MKFEALFGSLAFESFRLGVSKASEPSIFSSKCGLVKKRLEKAKASLTLQLCCEKITLSFH